MSAEIDTITVGDPMPRIAAITHVRDHVVSVTWGMGLRAGLTEEVDLAPVVMQFKVYLPLRDDLGLFAAVQLADEGAELVWDEGRIDMAATTVERLAADVMGNGDFRAWMERHHLTLDAAGAVLGLSRRQVAYYAKDRPVPRLVALACVGYDARHNDQRAA